LGGDHAGCRPGISVLEGIGRFNTTWAVHAGAAGAGAAPQS